MNKSNDLRITRTHKSLCESFIKLSSRKKFEDITINELCDGAMIRRATFYNHFADKYDFFAFFVRQIQASLMSDFTQQYKRIPDDDHSDILCNYIFKKALDFFSEHIDMVNCLINSAAFSSLADILADEIQRNMLIYLSSKSKKVNEYSVSPTVFTCFYSGGLIRIITYWLKHQDTISQEEIYTEYKKLLAFNIKF